MVFVLHFTIFNFLSIFRFSYLIPSKLFYASVNMFIRSLNQVIFVSNAFRMQFGKNYVVYVDLTIIADVLYLIFLNLPCVFKILLLSFLAKDLRYQKCSDLYIN